MSAFQQILIGVAGGGVVALLSWYLLLRRLNVVARYYPHSQLGDDELAVIFTVLNRGHRNESDIAIELDPKRQYALVAHSSAGITLDGCILRVERLPGADDVGAILLVGGGDFNDSNVLRISSAQTKGRVFPKLESVPQPPGYAAMAVVTIFGFLGLAGWILISILQEADSKVLPDVLRTAESRRSEVLRHEGWKDILSFSDSTLADSYALNEYPISVRFVRREGDFVVVEVSGTNRSNSPFEFTVSASTFIQHTSIKGAEEYVNVPKVDPGSIQVRSLRIYYGDSNKKGVELSTSITPEQGSIIYAKATIPAEVIPSK